MLKETLALLKKHGVEINNPFEKVVLSNSTREENNVLYIKNIPEGLLYIQNKAAGKVMDENTFKHTSTMIDLSRNAVMNLEYFKDTMIKHALLGFDEVWLYMEDVFKISTEPKFGYMRGSYSKEELKSMVLFAKKLGITLIPCIQTLGHFSQFLRWFSSAPYKDTFDVLKVRSDKTYELITDIIKTMREVFETNKIHVGMDETFGFGFGRYYKENGYTPQPELFMEHLIKVNKICLDNGFVDVYIWSDMFFRMYSKTESYYDPTITFDDSYVKQIPKNVGIVYWDYYNEDEAKISAMIEAHQKLKRKLIFASGTWIWTKLTYNKGKTDRTAFAHINAAKKYNIDEICFTQWQDDGAYCDYDSIYVGLYDVMNKIVNNTISKEVFNNITGSNYDTAIIYSEINTFKGAPINYLWDDILLGIYVNEIFGYEPENFDETINNYKEYINRLEKNRLHAVIIDFAKLILSKLEFRRKLLYNYQNKKPLLKELLPLLENIRVNLDYVIMRFRENWLRRYKFYGLEVIESRLYVFYARIEDAKYLFEKYDNKQIDKLEFLHEPLDKKEPYLSPKFTDTFYGTKVF
jgi:hexosaminidase